MFSVSNSASSVVKKINHGVAQSKEELHGGKLKAQVLCPLWLIFGVAWIGKYVVHGDTINIPSRSLSTPDGAEHGGWWKQDGTGGNWGFRWIFMSDAEATVVTGTVSLYSRWLFKHTLNFVTGLKPVYYHDPEPRQLREGELLGQEPSAPIMHDSSASFMGWFMDRAFQTEWNTGYHRMPGHDITIYARWGGFQKGEPGPSGGTIFYARASDDPFRLGCSGTPMIQ